MTEWVTIKIPEQTRDEAKDDPRTYEQIMRAGLDKPDTGDMAQAVADYASADEIAEALKNEISMAADPTVEVDTERIINRIDDLEAQLPRKVKEELQR